MIDIKLINEEINKLENCDTSYAVCEKLAILYIVREHYKSSMSNASSSPTRVAAPTMSPTV